VRGRVLAVVFWYKQRGDWELNWEKPRREHWYSRGRRTIPIKSHENSRLGELLCVRNYCDCIDSVTEVLRMIICLLAMKFSCFLWLDWTLVDVRAYYSCMRILEIMEFLGIVCDYDSIALVWDQILGSKTGSYF